MTQAQAVAKTMNQHHAAEVSKLGVVEAKTQCSQAFWHDRRIGIAGFGAMTQSSLLGYFVSKGKNRNPRPTHRLFYDIISHFTHF